MRKESEKKLPPISVRVSKEEYMEFEEAAAKEGMRLSTFLRNCAKHRKNSLKPCHMVHIQNVANMAIEIVKQYTPDKVSVIEKLESEMRELWKELG